MSQLTQASPAGAQPAPAFGAAAILARRYGEALYQLADEQKQIDAVATDLRSLRNLLSESGEFQRIAAQPRLTRAQLVTAMQNVAKAAKFSPLTGNFLALTAQNRRLTLLGTIIDAFLALLAANRGEVTADIVSAQPLTTAQQEQLIASLRDLAGGKVHLTLREDASLLGGLRVRIGSRLIDASLKTKLERLERQLKSPLVKQQGAA